MARDSYIVRSLSTSAGICPNGWRARCAGCLCSPLRRSTVWRRRPRRDSEQTAERTESQHQTHWTAIGLFEQPHLESKSLLPPVASLPALRRHCNASARMPLLRACACVSAHLDLDRRLILECRDEHALRAGRAAHSKDLRRRERSGGQPAAAVRCGSGERNMASRLAAAAALCVCRLSLSHLQRRL